MNSFPLQERLSINNFAGLKDINISLSRINILIGPQATGKSICAKCFFYFKSFTDDIFTAAYSQKNKRELDNDYKRKFQEYFSFEPIKDSIFSIKYEINDKFIQIESTKSSIKLTYSNYYANEFKLLKNQLQLPLKINSENKQLGHKIYEQIDNIRNEYFKKQESNLGAVSSFDQLFIPAGRSFFSILQSSIFTFLSNNKAIDPFLTEFGSLYENAKRFYDFYNEDVATDKNNNRKIDILVDTILKGKHITEKGKDYLISNDGRKVSLENSSSGQQEMLPLSIILKYIMFPFFNKYGNTVYIEEPEAHLFPDAQRTIVSLITTIFNLSKIPLQFVITTHSPYILAAFNNLIYASSVGEKIPQNSSNSKRRKLNKAVPEEQRIAYKNIEVYAVKDGIAKSIMSDEMELIETNILDEASDIITNQFDKILNLDE